MRGMGGFVLLAGIGVGLFVYFPAPVDRARKRRSPRAHLDLHMLPAEK